MPLVRTRPYTEALGSNPVVERLRAPWGQGRVLGVNRRHADDRSAIPVTYATPFGIEGVRGFNPLIPRSTYELLRAGVGGLKLDWEPAMTIRSFPLRNRHYLDLFNVRWIVANRPVRLDGLVQRDRFDDLFIYHFQSPSALTHMPATYLYENPQALPRAALVRTARLERDSSAALRAVGTFDPRHVVLVEEPSLAGSYPGGFEELAVAHEGDRIALDFDAGAGGYLVLSEVFYPGWRAEDRGRPLPVGRANGIFQVLRVGPGHHEIVLRYFPSSFAIGLWLSLGAALLSAGLVLTGWLKGRSETQKKNHMVRRHVLHAAGIAVTLVASPAATADVWRQAAPLPEPRSTHGAALGGDGRIYVLGGLTPRWNHPMRAPPSTSGLAFRVYDPETEQWSSGPTPPTLPSRTLTLGGSSD
jgi:hypothetical protein